MLKEHVFVVHLDLFLSVFDCPCRSTTSAFQKQLFATNDDYESVFPEPTPFHDPGRNLLDDTADSIIAYFLQVLFVLKFLAFS